MPRVRTRSPGNRGAASWQPALVRPAARDWDVVETQPVVCLLPFVQRLTSGMGVGSTDETAAAGLTRSGLPTRAARPTTNRQPPDEQEQAAHRGGSTDHNTGTRRTHQEQAPHRGGATDHQPAAAGQMGAGCQPRRPRASRGHDRTRGKALDYSFLLFPDTKPHLTIFGVCQGWKDALTNTENREHNNVSGKSRPKYAQGTKKAMPTQPANKITRFAPNQKQPAHHDAEAAAKSPD
jgi:hypothetical protein